MYITVDINNYACILLLILFSGYILYKIFQKKKTKLLSYEMEDLLINSWILKVEESYFFGMIKITKKFRFKIPINSDIDDYLRHWDQIIEGKYQIGLTNSEEVK